MNVEGSAASVGERAGISVLVSTRDRSDDLRRCVASLLACDYDRFEVIVIDQSSSMVELPDHPALRHVFSSTRGKSAGLNVALAMAKHEHIAFTDDDCTVPCNWLSTGSQILGHEGDVALVFGCLDALPHDPSTSFVPTAKFPTRLRIDRATRAHRRGGAGANMFSRRSHVLAVGGFDESLGPGARYPACEELDLYFRTLITRRAVLFEPDLRVVHWNGRPYADGSGRALLRSYAFGEGAVIGKHLCDFTWQIVPVFARILLQDITYLGANLVRGRLTGAGLMAAKWRGLLARVVDGGLPFGHRLRPGPPWRAVGRV